MPAYIPHDVLLFSTPPSPPSTMPPYIPPELLLEIANLITDTRTLTAAARVNHFLHTHLQSTLNRLKIFYLASLYLRPSHLLTLAATSNRVRDAVSPMVFDHRGLKANIAPLVRMSLGWFTLRPRTRRFLKDEVWKLEAKLDERWRRAVGGAVCGYIANRGRVVCIDVSVRGGVPWGFYSRRLRE